MKIVALGTRGFPRLQGGIEKHCEELYPRLAARGCRVTVISRAPYTGAKPYRYRGVTVLPLSCPRHKFFETFVHTFRGVLKARRLDCDILHIHAIGPSLFVPMARLLGMKVVVTHHGPDYERRKWNAVARSVLKIGEQWGVTGADQVIAVSRAIAAQLERKFGRTVPVIPNGVVISPRAEDDALLDFFGLERGRYILAVGRFVPEKGFNELIDAFQLFCRTRGPENGGWKLVIAGDADHEDAFSRELKKKGRSLPDVVLTGFQDQDTLKVLYSQARLFVLPSSHEGLPITLLEALSYGVPCLVSDIPANREVGLEDACYFSPVDISGLSRKLAEFLERPFTEEQRREMTRLVRERYDWDMVAWMTFSVYAGMECGGRDKNTDSRWNSSCGVLTGRQLR